MFVSHFFFQGQETYENQMKFGKETFEELERINAEGYYFEGFHHSITVVCCCDWKAAACLEGVFFCGYNFIFLQQ